VGSGGTSAGRRHRSASVVEATLVPGASISVVARQYDVNANQVFMWRRRYRDAIEQPFATPCLSTPALVPVTITPASEPEAGSPAATSTSDTIEIAVGGDGRVRVGSDFDDRALERVLDLLRKQ
jgi:transposase